MNEIFSNEVSRLTLKIYVQGTAVNPNALPTASLFVSNDESFTGSPTTLTVAPDENGEEGIFTVAIPPAVVQEKRFAKVVYTYNLTGFGEVVKEEFYEIRTRLVAFEEYILMVDDAETDYNSYNLAETESRMIIEAYTRQKFSRWTGQRHITGDPNRLYLPQYMRELTGVTDFGDYQEFDIANNDYLLEPSGMVLARNTKPIRSAGPRKVTVTGKWGYVSVPDNVKKAAYELTRDFSSSVINKRRQYLSSSGGQGLGAAFTDAVDSISWRAYMDSTGNYVADQLLAGYRTFHPGVI